MAALPGVHEEVGLKGSVVLFPQMKPVSGEAPTVSHLQLERPSPHP